MDGSEAGGPEDSLIRGESGAEDRFARAPATRRQRLNDVYLAIGVFALALLSEYLSTIVYKALGFPNGSPWQLKALVIAGLALPLSMRRRWPVGVLAVQLATNLALFWVSLSDSVMYLIALFIAFYSIGAWEPRRRLAFWSRVLAIIAYIGLISYQIFRSFDNPDVPGQGASVATSLLSICTNTLFFGGAWYFGENMWRAACERMRLRRQTQQLAEDREKLADQRVLIERLRIARELHDVVGHHVSAMGIQASAARAVLSRDPGRAASIVETIEESARDAVEQMRSLLGALRSDEDSDSQPAGSSMVEDLPALVRGFAKDGAAASLDIQGEPRELPPLISRNLFRVTQEALTNVVRHAQDVTLVEVRLRYLPSAVEVEIMNDGRFVRSVSAGGFGLLGMRERVSMSDGTLIACPARNGGFLVRATIPMIGMAEKGKIG